MRDPASEGAPLDLWCADEEGLLGAFGTFLSSSLQVFQLSLLLPLAWERVEWGWHGPQGMPGDIFNEWCFISALLSFAVLWSVGNDPEPMVTSLAAQTMLLVSMLKDTPGRSRRRLWCC